MVEKGLIDLEGCPFVNRVLAFGFCTRRVCRRQQSNYKHPKKDCCS